MKQKSNEYLSSKETMKTLKISSCSLMHLREAGKLEYVKKGNAFLYSKPKVLNIKKRPDKNEL